MHYMSMEYLEGGTLEDRLVEEGQLSPYEAVIMAIDAARALGFAEMNGIVHRDIKPANLLLTTDGKVKVGDLGIATDLRRQSEDHELKAAGSPRYMAPEQARGKVVDHRADVYGLGATLYRAIAGVPPIDGATVTEILKAKLERDPVPLRRLVPEVGQALSSIVQKMLERNPEDTRLRFGLALEYLRAGRSQDGVRELRAYLAASDDEGNAWGRLAAALEEMGEREEAKDAYRRGIDVAHEHGHPTMAEEFEQTLAGLES